MSWSAPSQSRILPAWATVHLAWELPPSTTLWVVYLVTDPTGVPVYTGSGTNGTATFTSVGGAYTFSPSLVTFVSMPINTTCVQVTLQVQVTYSP